jgi:hypothetical protein
MKSRVLMIAYACDPQAGGEHWLGWGWAEQAARNYSVELITTPKAEHSIKERSSELGITAHFVQASPIVRKLSERIGADWWRKFAWQKEVLRLARRLQNQKPFQIVHQTTFHTFRVPFLAANLGIPSVWGPIAGGEAVPAGFERFLGTARRAEAARRNVNRLWLNFPAVKRSIERSSMIFVSNKVTKDFLPLKSRAKCQIVPPNALRAEDEQFVQPPVRPPDRNRPFKLI